MPKGENWTTRDDIALEIWGVWLSGQVKGKDLLPSAGAAPSTGLPESTVKMNMEHAFRLADMFLAVQRAAPSK